MERATGRLDTEVGKFIGTVEANLPEASDTGDPKAVFQQTVKVLRDRIRPNEYQDDAGTYFVLARFNKKEVLLAVGSSRTLAPPVKLALLKAVSSTLKPPAWLGKGSRAEGSTLYGVGEASTLEIKNYALAQAAAQNRARAALANLSAPGAAEVQVQGAQVEDYWLSADGVLHALVKLDR